MAQWATAAELASLVQRAEVDTITSNLLLTAAADVIRNEVVQDIDLLTTLETYDGPKSRHGYNGAHRFDGTTFGGFTQGESVLFLRQRPCISITLVTENQGTGGIVDLVQGVDYSMGEGGRLYRFRDSNEDAERAWTTVRQGIAVTYTHGWDVTTPQYQTAKMLSMQLAARAYLNPESLYELRVGGYQESRYSRATPVTGMLQLTPVEKIMLDSLRSNWLTA